MRLRFVCLLVLITTLGCASFDPRPGDPPDFLERAVSQTEGGVTVSTVVLTPAETKRYFGVPLEKQKIQPVWLRIENRSDTNYVLVASQLDSEYFSSYETSWKNHFFLGGSANREMDDYIYSQKIRSSVPARETSEGFVYTNRDYGVKMVRVLLLTNNDLLRFEILAEIPGLKADYLEVDFANLYAPDEIVDLDLAGLKTTLEGLPCCVLGGDRETDGDPLNLVIIAAPDRLIAVLAGRGWHVTERIHLGSLWGTVRSSVFGAEYKTSPISELYLFNRGQDVGFQKARDSVDERNHLRLWLSPYRFEGLPVWVGQISRDIGVRLSRKTGFTHEIDPQVDEARDYLAEDLLLSEAIESISWVEGVGEATKDDPRRNFTLSPYFTDGWRVVLLLSEGRVPLTEVDFYDWDQPPGEWE